MSNWTYNVKILKGWSSKDEIWTPTQIARMKQKNKKYQKKAKMEAREKMIKACQAWLINIKCMCIDGHFGSNLDKKTEEMTPNGRHEDRSFRVFWPHF